MSNMNTTTAIMSQKPVDLVHLAKQTMGDRDLEREVLSLFVNQSSIYLKRLVEAKSGAERKMAAHTIVGSARGLGACKVAEEAAKIEANTQIRMDYCELTGAVDEANTYIGKLIN